MKKNRTTSIIFIEILLLEKIRQLARCFRKRSFIMGFLARVAVYPLYFRRMDSSVMA